ncbi:MAG: L-2,4-diaminobutyrate decarboxylase [Gemmatimonadaceae bacterium]|nr:L-2,4-diaminobutyrate decarboxylase [Gemmatimonadaceae bacterium]
MDFLSNDPASHDAWARAIDAATALFRRARPRAPYSGASPATIAAQLPADPCPEQGMPLDQAVAGMDAIVRHSIIVGLPGTAAHLHCPPLIPALAAEVVLSVLNQSMDSFDQAPAATMVEEQLCAWLCARAGLPAGAGGTFTSGGTQSNAMGLWLARDAHLAARGWPVRARGLPPDAGRLVMLCSEVAHFTVDKSAMQLGLGTDSVVKVPVDDGFAMHPAALREVLAALRRDGRIPFVLCATAGTTDHGAIDPLPALADAAQACGAWLHVDAAYGGALLFSDTRRHALAGIERADSIGLDFHKLLWQPVSCGVFLLRDAAQYAHITTHADYLNPVSHLEQGVPDLVNRSLATTRRFDALKVWLTFQALGRRRLGGMIDATCDLAGAVARAVAARPALELVHAPVHLTSVLFRYRADDRVADALNQAIRDTLLADGTAVIGTTRVSGRATLKLTLLHPEASVSDLHAVLDLVVARGDALVAAAHGASSRG